MKTRYIVIPIFAFIIISSPLFSSEPVKIDESLESIPIGVHIEYLEDKDGRLSIDDITQKKHEGKWILSKKKSLGFGFAKSVYWIRFTTENTTDKEINFNLEQTYPLIDYLTLYKPENGKYTTVETGDMLNFNKRPVDYRTFVFPLIIKKKSTAIYYLQYGTQSSMNIDLIIWKPSAFQDMANIEYRILFMFYAVMVAMILYNFILFFIVRRMEYLYYVLSLLFGVLFLMSLNAMSFQLFWPDNPWWHNYSMPVIMALEIISLSIFATKLGSVNELKDTGRFRHLGYLVFNILLGFGLANFIATLFLPYRIAMTLTATLTLILIVSIAILSLVVIILERHRGAIFGMIGGLFLLIGMAAFILKTFAVLPTNIFTEWSKEIGFVIMVMFFSIALADRINVLRKELAVLNETLEEKVELRTEELRSAMEEMEAMNETILETFNILEEAQRTAVKDMDMAANVQATLFPKEPPVTDDWEIAFTFKPMSRVSGDLFDFYFSGKELKGISLFDVSGHGIASGLITMIARSVFYRNFENGDGKKLNEILQESNKDLINEMGEVENYLTGILLRFEKYKVEYVNAGHSDLLYKDAGSGEVKEINRDDRDFKGMFLGIEAINDPYESLEFEVSYNDILFLFTDCIYESKNSEGEEYGMEKLTASFKSAPDGSANDIQNHIMKEFYSFLGDAETEDDLTLIVAKRK